MSDNAESLRIIGQALEEGWTLERLCFALAGDRVLFPRKLRTQRAEMIRRMSVQGMSPAGIAEKVGCSDRNVRAVLRRAELRALQVPERSDTMVAQRVSRGLQPA